jgi:adenylate cyclase
MAESASKKNGDPPAVGQQSLSRRLVAVMALDTAGYSRLMHEDEEGTHRRLTALMREVIEPAIEANSGQIVKKTGDGALVMFPRAETAVRAAITIQREMRRRTVPGEPASRRIVFRIGINLGDVIVEHDDIYGDGVNIAARLEGIAHPGTVLVSETVANQALEMAEGEFVDLGERLLKNIARPIRVFGVTVIPGEGVAPLPSDGAAIPGFIGRPAVAVLPFRDVRSDPDQEFFIDGLTEDLIIRLSAWRSFPVIARNSVFAFKGQSVDPRAIGEKLGARYVVQGDVRRTNDRVRVNVEVADAATGHVIMAERFDREYSDLFALQDELANSVTGLLAPELLKIERERLVRESSNRLDSYELQMKAVWHHYRYTPEDNLKALRLLREAVRVDPTNAQAVAHLAIVTLHTLVEGWPHDVEHTYDVAFELAQRAVALDARDATAHFALALVCRHTQRRELDLPASREAVRLNPSHAAAYIVLAGGLNYTGQPEEGRQAVEVAMRLSPYDPRMFLWLPAHAMCLYQLRRYEDVLPPARKSLATRANYVVPLRYLVAALGQLGRREEAAEPLAMLRRTLPNLDQARAHLARYYQVQSAIDHVIEGLAKAGMPS